MAGCGRLRRCDSVFVVQKHLFQPMDFDFAAQRFSRSRSARRSSRSSCTTDFSPGFCLQTDWTRRIAASTCARENFFRAMTRFCPKLRRFRDQFWSVRTHPRFQSGDASPSPRRFAFRVVALKRIRVNPRHPRFNCFSFPVRFCASATGNRSPDKPPAR